VVPGEEDAVTTTVDEVTARKKKPEPSAEAAAVELVRPAKERAVSSTGPDGAAQAADQDGAGDRAGQG
jgi:hypothetical protein